MSRFAAFVVLAEMRTGSNFLEAQLAALGARCHGEAFNPHFLGTPGDAPVLGFDRAARDAEPLALLAAIRAAPGLHGFRYFGDHDPRILGPLMADAGIAKIVLTRDPLDAYLSRKIAALTGQWKLTEARDARRAKVRFDPAEFAAHRAALARRAAEIEAALQREGQAAFRLAYPDLQDLGAINGLAAYLELDARLDALDGRLKRQNPGPAAEKVENPEEMAAALARMGEGAATEEAGAEPERGAMLPGWLFAARSPLVFMPLGSGPEAALAAWLAALDGAPPRGGFNRRDLRDWRRAHPGHRGFAVLRHPLARAHAAYCERILAPGPARLTRIRETLRARHGLPIAAAAEGPDPDPARHRAGFASFLRFLHDNLAGRSALRVDPAWASQGVLLQGVARLAPPDLVLREADLGEELPRLARRAGRPAPDWPAASDPWQPALAAIHDAGLERLARAAYGRDYESFGFGPWRPLPG
ncbi:nodulation protein NodH [Limimaricola pyoseonensis]|uniref:LPS sulfotransferase NodH n=1 Tax=Limimaricola pyoseonensis TaxID=521013 RepID=A0A1G7ETJ7_9RHOB|nr:nodulation protein NodH [Limimaricola pyoseonensis]SDE66959.1 hypothetical protein SAMN04488567_2287 [Limimaricola pyoseonensis]